jgi:hypothetical protein
MGPVSRQYRDSDLFQPARFDPKYKVEHYAEVYGEMVKKEGKFDYIGLS